MGALSYAFAFLPALAGCDVVFIDEPAPCAELGSRAAPMSDDFATDGDHAWAIPYEQGGSVLVEGSLRLRAGGSAQATYAGVRSTRHDMCGRDLSIEIVQPHAASATSCYTIFSLQHGDPARPTDIDFFLEDGLLKLPGRSLPFTADHRWWRIRVAEPRVQLETSPDGRAWTMQTQVATPEGVRDAWLDLGLGCDLGEATGVETVFDNLNRTP